MRRLVAAALAVLIFVGACSGSATPAAGGSSPAADRDWPGARQGVSGIGHTTLAQLYVQRDRLDPHHTEKWILDCDPAFTKTLTGQALPWNGEILISCLAPAWDLVSATDHEWSHVLQYRAFGSNVNGWYAGVEALNKLVGYKGNKDDYYGLEHQADCSAQAFGATQLYYGCPAALKYAGTRLRLGHSTWA